MKQTNLEWAMVLVQESEVAADTFALVQEYKSALPLAQLLVVMDFLFGYLFDNVEDDK